MAPEIDLRLLSSEDLDKIENWLIEKTDCHPILESCFGSEGQPNGWVRCHEVNGELIIWRKYPNYRLGKIIFGNTVQKVLIGEDIVNEALIDNDAKDIGTSKVAL